MRGLTYSILATVLMMPGYWTYSLNRSVDNLREDNTSVPFFAYYRYGVNTRSVVFNVNGADCETTIAQLLPTFEAFVRELDDLHAVSEVRLAWEGETIAVMPQSALHLLWGGAETARSVREDPLAPALRCSGDGDLVIDWSQMKPQGGAMT